MYSFNFDLHSHRAQLVLTALAASLATAGIIHSYNTYTKKEKRRNLNEEIYRSLALRDSTSDSNVVSNTNLSKTPLVNGRIDYDEELIREQLGRNYSFFGEESLEKIRGSSVVVVGCGGVGSWAAVMLVRSYVCYLADLFNFLYYSRSIVEE